MNESYCFNDAQLREHLAQWHPTGAVAMDEKLRSRVCDFLHSAAAAKLRVHLMPHQESAAT